MGLYVSSMVSDFFHPIAGGVEGHIYYLAVELIRRGHKVGPFYSLTLTLTLGNNNHTPSPTANIYPSPRTWP